jgi:antitoxin component of RelBE/YafQ-DinJ toxin-antitoxin module
VRVDAGLLKAFQAACKQYNLKTSDLMEAILWNALGEPPMSFEPGFREQDSASYVPKGPDT